MAEKVPAVDEIQAAIREAADRLEETVGRFELGERLEELEAHHPEDLEAMGSGDVCPSVAWMAHGAVERAVETLNLALKSLRRAGSYTAGSVRDDWMCRRLDSTRILLWRIMGNDDSAGSSGDGAQD